MKQADILEAEISLKNSVCRKRVQICCRRTLLLKEATVSKEGQPYVVGSGVKEKVLG